MNPQEKQRIEGFTKRAEDPDVWFSPNEMLEVLGMVEKLQQRVEDSAATVVVLAGEMRALQEFLGGTPEYALRMQNRSIGALAVDIIQELRADIGKASSIPPTANHKE